MKNILQDTLSFPFFGVLLSYASPFDPLHFFSPFLYCRLQGITKSVSRYPTFRRQFGDLVKTLTEDLAKKNGGSESTNVPKTMQKSNSALARFQKSFKRLTSSNNGRYEESQSQSDALRDLEIL